MHCHLVTSIIVTSITINKNIKILTYLHASRDDFHPGLFYTPHSEKNMAATKSFIAPPPSDTGT